MLAAVILVPRKLPTPFFSNYGSLAYHVMLMLSFMAILYTSAKASNQAPAGLLRPVEIPYKCLEVWLMAFITELCLCNEFNEIYTYVDTLTKFVKLIPFQIGNRAVSAPMVA